MRSWRLTVLATTSFVGAWLLLTALAVMVDRLLYAPLFAVMAGASAYNVRRFLPRPSDERVRDVALSPDDEAHLRERLQAHTDVHVPERVHLTADPFVHIDDDGVLRIGLPVVTCLSASDVSILVEDAEATRSIALGPAAVRARHIAEGRLGRGLRDGPPRTSRRLLARLDARAEAFYEALDEGVQAVRATRFDVREPTFVRHGLVVEAWWLVNQRWVEPALEEGHLNVQVCTGTRDLLLAATELDLTGQAVVSTEPLLDPVAAEAYEADVAHTLATGGGDDLHEVKWADHAPDVLLPRWRRTVARGLVAVERAVGEPRSATVNTFVEALEQGWGDAIAGNLAGPFERSEGLRRLEELLVAATWLAALEGPGTGLSWRWPFGPRLDLPDRAALDVEACAAAALDELERTGAMRGFARLLRENGIEADSPVWLGEGAEATPDRVLAAVVAHTGWLKNVVLVLSERTVRIYEDSHLESTRRDLRLRMVGPHETLDPLMGAVEDGEAGDPAVEVPVREVVHAELASILGGIYWRLRIWTVDDTSRIYGAGAPGLVEQVLEQLLQDRLATRGLRLPPHLQTARLWFTIALLGLGNLMILSGPIVWASGDAPATDALATSGLGLGLVLLVLAPGVVLSWLASGRARRRTGYQRPPARHASRRPTSDAA